MKREQITGIILAGGKSSRMGFDKSLANIYNKTFIEHILVTLSKTTGKVIIIANSDIHKFKNIPVYKDIYKNKGPLGGIHTGLFHSETKHNFIISCDTPFVTPAIIRHIINRAGSSEIAVPFFRGDIHPLCAYYNRKIINKLRNFIRNNHLKMKTVLEFFNFQVVPVDSSLDFYSPFLLANINTKEELDQIIPHAYEFANLCGIPSCGKSGNISANSVSMSIKNR